MKIEKKGFLLVLFCLILVFLLPHIVGYLTIKNYAPCNAHVLTDDCVWYPARYRDFYDGNFFVEDHLIYENKDKNVSALPFLDPVIYGSMLILLMPFTNINVALIIIKTIFVLINFLLLKKLGEKIFKDKIYSLFFSSIIVTNMIWKELVLIIFYILSLISKTFTNHILSFIGRTTGDLIFTTPLIFERAPRPNLIFIFLIGSIILLLKILENNKINNTKLLFYGLIWSSLFYFYLFYWIPFFISVGILSLIYFAKSKTIFKNLIIASSYSIIFSIPYWLNYLNFTRLNSYKDIITRIGIEQGHYIRVLDDYFIWLIVIVIFLLQRKKIKTEWFYFCLTFFAGAFIGLNLQLITGFNPHPDHWVRKVIEYLLSFMLLTVFYVPVKALKPKIRNTTIISLIVLVFFFASVWQLGFLELKKEALSLPEEELEVYSWLEQQNKQSVILSDNLVINFNIPFYTKHDIFFPQGAFTILSSDKIVSRMLKTHAILNYSEDELITRLKNDDGDKYKTKKDMNKKIEERLQQLVTYVELLGTKKRKEGFIFEGFIKMNETFSQNDIDKMLQEYREIISKKTIDLPEKVEYILTNRNLKSKTPFNNLEIKEVFHNKKYFIYSVKKL